MLVEYKELYSSLKQLISLIDRRPTNPILENVRLESDGQSLTIDEALRVLEALRGEQRGIGMLLEGPRRAPNGEY